MTIQELYDSIGGNYNRALQIMKSEKLIDRYVRKLERSGLGEMMEEAAKTMDGRQLFDSAHGMKGVCANLGLDDLAARADTITEEFRQANSRKMSDGEVKEKLEEILAIYRHTVEEIRRYTENA